MTVGASQPSPSLLPPLPDLRSTTVFGRRICYYDIGSGPPMVLVHGLGGDADQWAYCFEGLSASHRVVALELLGFGRSDKPPITYRIAGFVEVLVKPDRFDLWALALMEQADKPGIQAMLDAAGLDMFEDETE